MGLFDSAIGCIIQYETELYNVGVGLSGSGFGQKTRGLLVENQNVGVSCHCLSISFCYYMVSVYS